MRLLWVLTATLHLGTTMAAERVMTTDDLFAAPRLADPQLSPDGKLVCYQQTTVDLAANASSSSLYVKPADGNSPARRLTTAIGKKDAHPRWSPDGTKILFESNRAGTSQLFVIDLTGGEARQLTTIKTGANTGVWSPDGKSVAFVSTVYPEFSTLLFAEADAKNAERDEAVAKSPVKVRVFTRLFYRHWDQYTEEKRHHLFVCDADGGNCRDVTPGDRDAYPNSSTFSVGDDFTFTPDSKHLVFAAAPKENESWSTNYDLCRVAVDNKSADWEPLTAGNPAADNGPAFSPDGKRLAYRTQSRPGYEAAKWDIAIVDVSADGTFAGTPKKLTTGIDVSANDIAWVGTDKLAFTADDNGRTGLFAATADGTATRLGEVAPAGSVGSLSAAKSGMPLAFTLSGLNHPPEIRITTTDGEKARVLAEAHKATLGAVKLSTPESVTVDVEGGTMQMWLVFPPDFDKAKKYPLVYMIHGGPQGAWNDGWSYRWNPQLWAAQGYVVALPNPRGSTGFGQKFTDEISGDWGGKCYRDLEAGLAYLEKLPYIDTKRIASAGASFGGYMQNWFAVSPIAERLKCQISHCSVFNFESMWGTTDELWFDEYEHGGLPWEVPGKYAEFSPHKKAQNLGKYRVPMLVIHNDYDFRCPIGQGHELFQSLKRQGVESRFVNFPDEGHWVLKSQNSVRWHQECFAWLRKHVPANE